MKLGPVSGRPVGKQNWTPESSRLRVDEAKRIIGPDNPYLRSNIVARSHPRAIPVNKLRAYIWLSISVYLSSRIRFTNTVHTITLFPLMNNAAFVSFLARIGSRFTHNRLLTSTGFLAQRFIHCFVTIGFVLSPTVYFSKHGNVIFSLCLSFSLYIRIFAYFFSSVLPHRRKSYTYIALPRYLSASTCAKWTRKRTHGAHCVYTCSWKHTSVRQCVGA